MSEESQVASEAVEASVGTEATEQETAPAMTTNETVEVDSPATYADGKFQSVSDLENSYLELQSTFSKKLGAFQGAPEAYEFNEGFVNEDNQGLADMLTGWGTEHQLSNDGLNSLVSQYNEYNSKQKEQSIQEEFKKLGSDATARIDNARSFLEANLGPEATQGLAANMNTAAAIEGIEKLIAMTKAPKVAPSEAQSQLNEAKIKEMRFARDEYGNRKMENPEYRKKVLAMESQLKR